MGSCPAVCVQKKQRGGLKVRGASVGYLLSHDNLHKELLIGAAMRPACYYFKWDILVTEIVLTNIRAMRLLNLVWVDISNKSKHLQSI